MTERIEAVEGRVDRLESTLVDGLSRIEDLIRREVQGLKAEQIADLRKGNERLADDQRRLWDMVHSMQLDHSAELGSQRTTRSFGHAVTAILSGIIGGAATWLAQRWGGHP